ncbi:hypothetical protein SA13R_05270 [Rothia kristinae]|nr:hypothetical protein RSA5_08335 [Rothia kristinae]SIM49796.1 Uncharacterised protein [Mycobacteroides abscessus subsp. abscessus]KTR52596.1 hypothetical protein SA11R_09450 [Rothia kristinae]KTR69152.1 hypothetical protein SA12R_03890 [Rothia kristinae]KTR74412.1 hypothetical protein SA15R_00655 [Rothia kristinae]
METFREGDDGGQEVKPPLNTRVGGLAMGSGAGSAVQVHPRTGSRERECGAHQARRWSALHPDADADVT